MLERHGYVGGLAATFKHKGYKFDLGGHRWFTKNESLNDWFRHLMKGELVLVDRISRIYHNGQYFTYPDFRLKEILTQSHPLTIVGIGVSFLWSSLKQAGIDQPIVDMERAYIAQFGTSLYRMFFQRWGKSPGAALHRTLSRLGGTTQSRPFDLGPCTRGFARLAQRRRELDRIVYVSARRIRPYFRPHG